MKIKQNENRKKPKEDGGVKDCKKIEKIAARVLYLSGGTGLAAAFLVLAFHAFFQPKGELLSIFLAGFAVSLLVVLILVPGVRKLSGQRIVATALGKKYMDCCSSFHRLGWFFSLLLWVAGEFLFFNRFFIPGCFLIGFGIVFLVTRWMQQTVYATFTVAAVEGENVKEKYSHTKSILWCLGKWIVYWVVVLTAYFVSSHVFRSYLLYAPVLVMAFLLFLFRILVNNPFGSYAALRHGRLTVRFLNMAAFGSVVVLCALLLKNGCWMNNEYIRSFDFAGFTSNSTVTYDEKTGVYTLRATEEDFRILQLTDIHIAAGWTTVTNDRAAFRACYEVIKEAKPDLILVTGDMVYPIPVQTFSQDNSLPFYQFCIFMNQFGIPWAFVYGNHDTEPAAVYDERALNSLALSMVQGDPDCPLLYAQKQPEIYGRYNQYLRIENADGRLNRLIFLMDSNDYVKESLVVNEYDSIHGDQMQWYEQSIDRVSEEEGRPVPSFVFMHIPFRAFETAGLLLEAGSDEVEYLLGENGEGVSCPRWDSGFFERIVAKKSTQAVFVGHDHLNNRALRYRGVDLVYGRSIDYIAYVGIARKKGHRGGTMVVLTPDGSYEISQVVYDR